MSKKIILAINISGLGDIISSTVVLNYLKDKYEKVHLIIKDEFSDLFYEDGQIEVIDYRRAKEIKYDILIDLTSSKSSRKIVKKITAKIKLGMMKSLRHQIQYFCVYNAFVFKGKYNNIVRDYYSVINYFGGIPADYSPSIYIKKNKAILTDLKKKSKSIGIHIGSRNRIRAIPVEKILTVINFCKINEIDVILIGTEEDIAEKVLEETDYPQYNRFKNMKDLKSVVSKLDLFIGPDSGVLHLSSAMSVPSIGIFGPNLCKISGPISSYFKCIEIDLECRPCKQKIEKCKKNIECLNKIPDEIIFQEIKDKLNLDYNI